ncbi:hypothetical protein HG536_0B06840 [Torulaspora globosa]|uniref:rRNA-processing protein FYV7 n=1 Tax=Torulaspora globosa TaxID=48254 RepID=A0A7G3ZE80_9SACH|nr:uncharacterized protein HG536_0B06840 [Torulaspora globosa]QLL31816.1 hypothetical protein HG536_0B06840 [Torulaspora globosa]
MATAKQQQNRKKYTKDYKLKEIQKSLTHKARLKKEYLKALKEEGYSVPDKKPVGKSKEEIRKLKKEVRDRNRKKLEEQKHSKKQAKKEQREASEDRRKKELENIKHIKSKMDQREKRKQRLTKKTRTGQPLMGPKIEDLLGKIKEDDTYTK